MAKFPHRGDDWSVTGWEMVALDLAELCGATTPPHRVIAVGDAHVLVVTRFDRLGSIRIPYVSAMTLLDRTDGANADYLEIAEALTDHSPHATADLHELWTRIAVSVAINNTDDHLRNHGFVRHDGGWALSPVFDLNPNPDSGADRVTPLGGASDRASSIEALVELSDWFDLDADSARRRWAHVAATVASAWRDLATNVGIRDVELARFATTFQR